MRKTFFLGRVTRDFEIKYTQDGLMILNSGIAINEKFKDKEKTYFFDFVCFGKKAEILNQYSGKGQQLFLECRPETQSWEKDGKKHYKTIFNVENFTFTGQKNSDNKQIETSNTTSFTDDDIPF